MCVIFSCPICFFWFHDFCATARSSATVIHEIQPCVPELCSLHPRNGRQKCKTCEAIVGAIAKLQHLVFLYPWLETEGLSRLDSMETWEKEGLEGINRKTRNWDKQDSSREEEKRVAMEKKKMGLDDLKDERKEHQGFGSVSPTLVDTGSEIEWNNWIKTNESAYASEEDVSVEEMEI